MNERERELAEAIGPRSRPKVAPPKGMAGLGWFATRPTPVRAGLVLAVFLPASAAVAIVPGFLGQAIGAVGFFGLVIGMRIALLSLGGKRWREELLPSVAAAAARRPGEVDEDLAATLLGHAVVVAARDPEAWKAATRGQG